MQQPPVTADRHFWLGQTGRPRGRIEGKVEKNRITITRSRGAGSPVVYLHDELVDLKKPVTVVVDGEERPPTQVHARYSVLLHTIATANDPAQWFAHALEIR